MVKNNTRNAVINAKVPLARDLPASESALNEAPLPETVALFPALRPKPTRLLSKSKTVYAYASKFHVLRAQTFLRKTSPSSHTSSEPSNSPATLL
jgi:hypothetical protein